jgi:hypothetical protein
MHSKAGMHKSALVFICRKSEMNALQMVFVQLTLCYTYDDKYMHINLLKYRLLWCENAKRIDFIHYDIL